MHIDSIQIGHLKVSKFIIGGNPFSGYSHQGAEKDMEMKRYYTVARIKETLRQAEDLGIDTFIGRTDNHIMRMLLEYWDEGGTIQWIAQTATGLDSIDRAVKNAIAGGAEACFIHGGQMDRAIANKTVEKIHRAVSKINDAGMPAGIAGHNPKVFEWAEENLDIDFYMVSYYDPSSRAKQAEYSNHAVEKYPAEDRELKARLIQKLSKPAIHYKIMAAGRNNPEEAISFVAKNLRPQDGICVGIYTRENPQMIKEDLHLFEQSLAERQNPK